MYICVCIVLLIYHVYVNIYMTDRNEKEKMKLISVHLPEWMVMELEELVMKGYFPSRSEAIRIAVHQLLITIKQYKNIRNVELVLGR